MVALGRGGSSTEWKKSVCCYCGVGCGILAKAKDGAVSAVKGDPESPVNNGSLCAKGALLPGAITTETRLTTPIFRAKDGTETPTTWDAAIDRVATAIRENVAEHGPDSIMLYGSGQLLTEDYYLFGKLAKGFIGTNNQDTNSRLCMASAVAGYNLALGSDAPPAAYADIEKANTFLIVGANMEACHPILFNRVKARKKAGGDDVRIIVVDPRRTRTAEAADTHLALRPGTDVALLNALLYETSLLGGLDDDFIANHTEGFDELREGLSEFQAERAADLTGIDAQVIVDIARVIATNGPMLTLWTMGANQSTSGVDKNLALINLSLATGNIGKPGAGPFSLTGQPNAMGGREAGGLSTTLPGHRMVANAAHRGEIEAAWGLPAGSISKTPGITATEMVERLESGQIKVVWVAATNPLASLPNTDRVRAAFAKADLVVVQDPYHPTETTLAADVVLPAAQWSEREGTMTNSERRICLLEQVGEAPGEALPDWEIICRVAKALGYGRAFDYDGPETIFEEYRALTAGRDLDITGVSYDLLRRHPGVQWPAPRGSIRGRERLFTDNVFPTPSGRARFHVPGFRAPADEVTEAFPFVLLTGRVKDQWHTRTRTGSVAKLNKSEPGPFLELHPRDARELGIDQDAQVRVTSRRGAFEVPARVTDRTSPGVVFAPFHWGQVFEPNATPNLAASEAFDPRSKEPELKFAAVHLELA